MLHESARAATAAALDGAFALLKRIVAAATRDQTGGASDMPG
jgi:hypothetical protein